MIITWGNRGATAKHGRDNDVNIQWGNVELSAGQGGRSDEASAMQKLEDATRQWRHSGEAGQEHETTGAMATKWRGIGGKGALQTHENTVGPR